MKIAFDACYIHPLPQEHRFPMVKYELIPAQLLREGVISPSQLFHPAPAPEADILRAHTVTYWHKLRDQTLTPREQRPTGFVQSPALTHREIVIAQGSIDCARFALQDGIAMNVAGGTHHAFADRGEGFCLLNDFAIAALHLLHHGLAKQILVIDLDVHQGNGTAAIFAHEPRVFTFSMHGQHNYPFHKETSDLDIPLPDGLDDAGYLRLLYDTLPHLLATVRPDFVFYLSGVDVLATDRFGKLHLTPAGCRARDVFVLETIKCAGLPCVVAMGGGYSPLVKDVVNAHCETFRAAMDIWGF
ncbi:histone deacetylase [Chitinophaga parva]|uniref:Histone deacetylase n=1 Tax=Chitinophaga parva TaxID=2169414 RepID=A0A2T7BNT0_9BACT|nr:histone deacetylase [Chitinophaga parva]PUZ29322.1 histone deacetylase [Chitinophaga parva]